MIWISGSELLGRTGPLVSYCAVEEDKKKEIEEKKKKKLLKEEYEYVW